MMKKLYAVMAAALLLCGLLTACGSKTESANDVDLTEFYNTLAEKYGWGDDMMDLDSDMLAMYYPGLGEISAQSFATPHDAPGSVGYLFSAGGKRAAVVTDLGYLAPTVSDALTQVDLALVEANHDVDWLRTGPYPYYLQERVLGKYGHLSNEACGELSVRLARSGASTLVLAHLSQENNTPQRAKETVSHMLESAGCGGVQLYVAPRDELSQAYCV